MSSKTPSFDAEIPDVDRYDQETDVTPPRFAGDSGESAEHPDASTAEDSSPRTVHEADDGDVIDQTVVIEFDGADDYPSED